MLVRDPPISMKSPPRSVSSSRSTMTSRMEGCTGYMRVTIAPYGTPAGVMMTTFPSRRCLSPETSVMIFRASSKEMRRKFRVIVGIDEEPPPEDIGADGAGASSKKSSNSSISNISSMGSLAGAGAGEASMASSGRFRFRTMFTPIPSLSPATLASTRKLTTSRILA